MTKQYNNPTGKAKKRVAKPVLGGSTSKQVTKGYNAFLKKYGLEKGKLVLGVK